MPDQAAAPAAAPDFDGLFRRIYPSLFRYAHRMTGDVDAAEDIAQEAFVRLLRRPLPEGEARLWLFTVAANLFRDAVRTTRRRRRLLEATPVDSVAAADDESPDRTRAAARVRVVLDSIPQRDRQLLLMREEGFRYDEIARAVGVAPGSVGTLLARALRRFTTAYNADGGK